VYELFPPALPRELGLVLLGAGGVVLGGGRPSRVLAGVLFGLAGLTSVPIFVVAFVWILAAAGAAPRGRRTELLWRTVLPAGVVFGLWAIPVAVNFAANGGFVNITPELGVEWPLASALWSWGLLLPLALVGLLIAARRQGDDARLMLALVAATVVLLALAVARGAFDWNLAGNATLLHQGRVWPVAHLLAAAFAGIAIALGYEHIRRRSPAAALAATGVLFVAGAVSLAYAAIALTEVIETHDGGYLYNRPDFDADAFVPRASDHLDASDVVYVRDSDFLAFLLFSFSGARLAAYDDDRLDRNDLRIRYADLAGRWDEQMADGGFDADYTVVRAGEAGHGAEPVVRGRFRNEQWVLLPAVAHE
jgi:hypothetical protein